MSSEASGWEKHWSKTHNAFYWHNKFSNKTSWTVPEGLASAAPTEAGTEAGDATTERPVKRRAVEGKDAVIATSSKTGPKVAVIVPFRDLHTAQKRQQHLDIFVPEMASFLEASGVPFCIYIIEQSNDGRKFNRGKLLNIGFEIASKEGCQVFVLHDVDLLPSKELMPWYTRLPSEQPVHIARVWSRYNDNLKYFGGIVAFSEDHYRKINGFPNNFWGWGGEDDEMFKRIQKLKLTPTAPTVGSIRDLEDMSLTSKLAFLKSNPTWKCMNKTEVLAEHEHWKENGLSSLEYTELKRVALAERCAQITVDVHENNHWTDLVCKLDDAQYDKSVEALKADFAKKGGGSSK